MKAFLTILAIAVFVSTASAQFGGRKPSGRRPSGRRPSGRRSSAQAIKSPGDVCGCTGIPRRPVCGTDGNTYNNECELQCANRNAQVDDRLCCRDTRCREYRGRENLNGQCKPWINNVGIFPSKPDPIRDSNFPDGTVRKAQNYCRNPDGGPSGLWCYTGRGKPFEYKRCSGIALCGIAVAYQGSCRN